MRKSTDIVMSVSACYLPVLDKLKGNHVSNKFVERPVTRTVVESKLGVTRQIKKLPAEQVQQTKSGVLSLGLPTGLTLFKKKKKLPKDWPTTSEVKNRARRRSLPRKLHHGHESPKINRPSSALGHHEEMLQVQDLINKRDFNGSSGTGTSTSSTRSSSSSGLSSGGDSADFGLNPPPPIPSRARPPRPQPRGRIRPLISPCPPVKLHPCLIEAAEIADEAKSSEDISSSSSSSANESDSIGGGRKADQPAATAFIQRKVAVTTTAIINSNEKKLSHQNQHQPLPVRRKTVPTQVTAAPSHHTSSPSSASSSSHSLRCFKEEGSALSRLSPSVHLLKMKSNNSSPNQLDMGYHTLLPNGGHSATTSSSSVDVWDVRATRTPISDLHLLTHNAKHPPVAKRQGGDHDRMVRHRRGPQFDDLPDNVLVHVLSFLDSAQIARCARVSRRFYFLAWDPQLWRRIRLDASVAHADLALKTVVRLLARNANASGGTLSAVCEVSLTACRGLTDRGLAIVARRCHAGLQRLEVTHCDSVTNGGVMDLVTKCDQLNHLDVTGCSMISAVGVHQPQQQQHPHQHHPPPTPPSATSTAKHRLFGASASTFRTLNLQYLDLSDCLSVEDAGLKMVVETCPQLQYLFLRRCVSITDVGLKYVSSYCLSVRELSFSDCTQITDFGLYELAKLGPNLRYLSVAKCDQISDSGVRQIAKLCYKLRYLNVRGCEAVSDEAIEMLALSCSRLRLLDIGKCDVTDAGLKLLSEHCPNLKKLSVKSCEMVSDRGIQYVAYYCRGLQQLNIQDCPVTIDGYRTVKKYCRRCVIEHTNPGFY